MLPSWLIFVAAAIRLSSGGRYIFDIFKGKARPNPISWFCWGLAPLIAAVAQIMSGVGSVAVVTLALGIGPMTVFIVSLFKSRDRTHFTTSNIACGILALVGIVLWYISTNPLMAISFSIFADFAGAIPTVRKCYSDPSSEPFVPYMLSIIAMALTFLTIKHWTYANFAYPVYITMINTIILSSRQLGISRKLAVKPAIIKT